MTRGRLVAAAGSTVLVLVGATSVGLWYHDRPPGDVAPPSSHVALARVTSSPTPRAGTGLPTHSITLSRLPSGGGRQPAALSVPAEQITGRVRAVGTDPRTRLLRVPNTTTRIVWWAYGARPGDAHGSVVLAAHVDYNGKLGLFFDLDRTPIGAVVHVRRHDGQTISYRVVGRQHVDKANLRQLGIFTRSGRPRLVLITCGGSFDAATRSYRDNVVVAAQPVT
jgi:Sortase domain